MNQTCRCIAVCAVLMTSGDLAAHGGSYRGPGDMSGTTSSKTNSGGGAAPAPAPATTGGSSTTPTAPTGPVAPAPVGVRGAAARGFELGEDLGRWQIWWSYHRDPYLDLRSAIHLTATVPGSDDYCIGRNIHTGARDTLRPSAKDVAERIYPRLRQALEKSRQRDTVSSCLVALARIGHRPEAVLPLLRTYLADHDQEIAETAALCYGILGDANGVEDLTAIVLDRPRGRELTARPSGVGYRTRAFAAYALGLIAHDQASFTVKEAVAQALLPLVHSPEGQPTDVVVAAIHGVRLLRVAVDGPPPERTLANQALAALMAFYEAPQGRVDLAQAHIPSAIAGLVGRNASAGLIYRQRFVRDLQDDARSNHVRQSCAQALGAMITAGDEELLRQLRKIHGTLREQHTRRLLAIALGEIGGAGNRQFLLQELASGRKQDKAWVTLALGIHAAHSRARAASPEPDAALGEVLVHELEQSRNPEVTGAACLALGLAGCTEAASRIVDVAREQARDDELCGIASLSLGLLGHKPATSAIQGLVEESVARPDRLRQAAIALGLLGDKTAAVTLTRLLQEKTSLAAQSALASALGAIGDQRSIEPLGALLDDENQQPLTRAFAAVALGIIADRRDFAWNVPLARGLNYHVATETLSNGASGILDIL